ncbi:oleate hydratase [Paenibacillus thiaminolyticus]|uniref:Oleate hydratase n=1 Tax=Paenibacillus thiaminolyticus TaxID=49283 RepID=A0AAP9J0Z3_PANTH|nr:oleate hydratase [Paenibacillus thiaminolyticus]MCY9533510.1 oleate hydratase [Paenibacillus thiaminolyticus]MCY9604175.1 oleate hydratase [Paenibacillus thiaminolyticus]MCY9606277.1 oleate hydratase [Paenibacillus thiaminolyticus]MCY9612027.1 oleate hydratase [Paenibacillus thiaminolyticus]MCY9618048.1 oleate hydratase [Paenibacillus thiaminolyticus]
MSTEYNTKQVYFVGGGIASLAGAAFLVRDCDFPGSHIHIMEEMKILGGSNDGSGNGEQGYVIRGGRMLNDETYENTWDLLSSIPSIDDPAKSVRDEIIEFDTAHPTHSNARLVNKHAEVQDVTSMGFDMADRIAMSKLIMTPEEKLGTARIQDWFGPHFFETNFWYMWATTFAFQPWHSAAELKRYMIRFMHEFPRIHTLEGVTRTPYNQYDSLTVPLHHYLTQHGVDFNMKCTVTDLDFKEGRGITVTKIHYVKEGSPGTIELNDGDLVIVTNGSMTEGYSLGSMTSAPSLNGKGSSWKLWDRIAAKKPGLGNPSSFDDHIEGSKWESFTVTCQDSRFFDRMEAFSRNKAGTGALVTFKESSWLMSIVLAHQPHFRNQPEHVRVFWGYGLFPDNEGDYVKKKMSDCTGEEILTELLNHLHFHEDMDAMIQTANCIPCMMPYITAQFMPRAIGDRPQVVPQGSTNLAFVGQFCEIPNDVVFTEEYSVRTARIAVYTLLGINKPIAPINEYQYDIRTLLNGLVTSFR